MSLPKNIVDFSNSKAGNRSNIEIENRIKCYEEIKIKDSPDPPEWLNDQAKTLWDGVIKSLQSIDLLTVADSNTLAIYCMTLAEYINHVRECGNNISFKFDKEKRSLLLTNLAKYGDQLGLNPRSRAALATRKAKELTEQEKRKKEEERNIFG